MNENSASRGVVYYAVGEEYLEEAIHSARSLKKYNNISTTVYTDNIPHCQHPFDDIEIISPKKPAFYDRIKYFLRSPYEKTLHLDTDTRVTGDIQPIFEMLDRFDIVATINETRDTLAPYTPYRTIDLDVPESFPEFQCGVLGYRNNRTTQNTFSYWMDLYEEYKCDNVIDQPFFRKAVYECDIDFGPLRPEYNLLINYGGATEGDIKIVHFAGSETATNFPFIGDLGMEDAVRKISKDEPERRIFYRDRFNRIRVLKRNESDLFRLAIAIEKYNLSTVLRKGIRHILSKLS